MAMEDPLWLSGGKLYVNDGKMVEVPSDCCCGDDCVFCEGASTPARFRVTFSSVARCTGCYLDAGTGLYVSWLTPPVPALAASYIVTQDPLNPCEYSYSEAVTAAWRRYTDAGCTITNDTGNLTSLEIRLQILAAHVNVVAWYEGGFNIADVFTGQTATATRCDGTTIINNTIAACAGVFGGIGLTWLSSYANGTATVVRI